MRIELVSWETVSGLRSGSSKRALKSGWFIGESWLRRVETNHRAQSHGGAVAIRAHANSRRRGSRIGRVSNRVSRSQLRDDVIVCLLQIFQAMNRIVNTAR